MFSKIPASLKVTFSLLLVAAFLFTGLGASSAQDVTSEEIEVVSPYLSIKHMGTYDGKELSAYLINGPKAPIAGTDLGAVVEPETAAGKIANFPSYNWVFGCSAVSGAMIAGYYDRLGYPRMYTGPTGGGVMPLTDTSWPQWKDKANVVYPSNPLIASKKGVDKRTSRGSIDDYWIQYNSTANDPYITGGWTQHTWGTSIGDYMKTSQSAYGNSDGGTSFYGFYSDPDQLTCTQMEGYGIKDQDGTYGRKLFYEKLGYKVTDCYFQTIDPYVAGGYTLAQYKAEINAGRPVFINLAGHSIVGYGYGTGNTIYIRNTWDSDPNKTYSMQWGGTYSGMQMIGVSIVKVTPPSVPTLKDPFNTITDKTPTYKFSPVWKATNYQFRVFKGASTTPVYTVTVAPSACSTGWCIKTPTTALQYAGYSWQARAYVGGIWKAWSAKKTFTIQAP